MTRVTRVGLVALMAFIGLAFIVRPHLTASAAQAPTPATAHRIISLVPAVTEMLFAIGAGPDVVGVSSYDRYPPDVLSRPRVGALVDPDFERILTLRPDLVIVYGSQTELIARLERSRVPIFNYRHAGLADITSTIRAIGARIGRPGQGARVADQIDADIAGVRRSVAGRPRPRTALIFGRESDSLRAIYASGGIGFLHDLLEAAGGEDVFADVRREGLQVSTETMLARAPDVILEFRGGEDWTPERRERERSIWKQLPSLPAARTNRIYLFTDDKFSVPGPRVADVARAMAGALHPQ